MAYFKPLLFKNIDAYSLCQAIAVRKDKRLWLILSHCGLQI
jgi:hypothetical protein